MPSATVTEAILNRKSVRVFKDTPVSKALMTEILQLAAKSASGSNLQPWKIYALTGSDKDQLIQLVQERAMSNPLGEEADIPIYPEVLEDPWNSRRKACGEVMYEALGITREDKMGRLGQVFKNFEFFGASVGLIVTMDRSLSQTQLIDVGMILQNIQLLARERGLDTCVQASWTMWPKTVREVLAIGDNEMVVAGASLGYADTDAKVNHIVQARMEDEECFCLRGFSI
jgi:nitroreductase